MVLTPVHGYRSVTQKQPQEYSPANRPGRAGNDTRLGAPPLEKRKLVPALLPDE